MGSSVAGRLGVLGSAFIGLTPQSTGTQNATHFAPIIFTVRRLAHKELTA